MASCFSRSREEPAKWSSRSSKRCCPGVLHSGRDSEFIREAITLTQELASPSLWTESRSVIF